MAYVKMHSYMKAYISYKVNKTTIYYAYINVLDLSCVGRSVGKTIIMPITVKPRRRKEIHMRDNSLVVPSILFPDLKRFGSERWLSIW